jgi:hypothetical protein
MLVQQSNDFPKPTETALGYRFFPQSCQRFAVDPRGRQCEWTETPEKSWNPGQAGRRPVGCRLAADEATTDAVPDEKGPGTIILDRDTRPIAAVLENIGLGVVAAGETSLRLQRA